MQKSRSQQRMGGGRNEPKKVISITREPEVQLQRAENPYKPAFKQAKVDENEVSASGENSHKF